MSTGRAEKDAELQNLNARLRHIQNRSKIILGRKNKEEKKYYLV